MHFPAPGADGDQSMGSEVAKDEGKEPKTKGVLSSQPSKVSTCPTMKIGPIAGHHMILPPLFLITSTIQSCLIATRTRL